MKTTERLALASGPLKSDVRPHIILVLGMHRSGTSALTRGLQVLGVELGRKLLPPAGDNDKGFFEDAEVVDLNERILAKVGRKWHSLEPLDSNFLEGPELFYLRNEATKLLNRRLAEHPLFGLKDPRLCILMPFWRCVLENTAADVSYVLALRNPLAAAQSLNARDGMSLEKGVALWGSYMLQAAKASESGPRVLVSFDALLANPLTELNKIADRIGLAPVGHADPELVAYANEFLESDMRHYSLGEKDLDRSGRAMGPVTALYGRLAKAASASDASADMKIKLNDIAHRFEEMRPLFRALDAADADRASLHADAVNLSEQVVSVISAHDDACEQRDNAVAQLKALSQRAEELDAQHRTVQAAHDAACQQRDEASAQNEALRLRADDLNAQIRTIKLAQDLACQQRDEAGLKNDTLDRHIAELDAQCTRLQVAYDAACEQRDTALTHIDALSLQLREIEAQRKATHLAHDTACEQRDEALLLNDVLSQRIKELDAHRRIVQAAHDSACQQRDDALSELNRRLESFEAGENAHLRMRSQLEADLARLTEKLSSLQLDRAALNARLSEQDGAFKAIQFEYTAQTGIMRDQLASEASRREDVEAQMSRDRAVFEKNTTNWHKERQALSEEFSKHVAFEEELSARIDELETSLISEEARTTELASERTSLNLHIHALEGAVLALRAKLEEAAERTLLAEATQKSLVGRTEILETGNHHQLETIRHLREQLERKQAEVRSYATSTSWKLTAPLRGISRLAKATGKAGISSNLLITPAPVSATLWKSAIGNAAFDAPNPPRAAGPKLCAERGQVPSATSWVGVAIHAFYPDMLDEILNRLALTNIPAKLYVTTPRHAIDAVQAKLEAQDRSFMLFQTDNRGRDMAPFLVSLERIIDDRAPLLLKVHTKSSTHLQNGARWRHHLLETLLSNGAPDGALSAFDEDSSLGLLAPDGHVLNFDDFLGENEHSVTILMQRLGIADTSPEDVSFVAGSMFYARPAIFECLLKSDLSVDDFEIERGKTDGTLAHAMERMIGILVKHSGLRLSEINSPNIPARPLGSDMYQFV